MSAFIYYFTGTGNSLFIARELAKEMESAKLIPIRDVIKEESIECDGNIVGIIFPVYFFGLPLIVSEFIQKLKLRKDQYCFGIAVHGGESGNSLYQLRKECQNVGIELQYVKDIKTCGAYIILYKPPKSEEFIYGVELQKAIKSIAYEITNSTRDISCIKYHPILRAIYFLSSKRWSKADKNFTNGDKCKGCGKCQRVCAVNNIVMTNNRPEWRHNCLHCMSCVHWCPYNSIQYKKYTLDKNRYRNPFITIEEIFGGN